MKEKMSFTASGDALIMHRLPGDYPGRERIREFIRRGDARITNLETTITHGNCFPSTFSGGTWLTAPEEVLEDVEDFGFNLFGVANNHMLDYSYEGLRQTLAALGRRGICFAGAGDSLAKASRPAVAETGRGRAVFIAITSTFDDTARAGIQGPYLPARPGVNPLRRREIHCLSPERMGQLREIADVSGVNVKNKRRLKTGYKLKAAEDIFEFRDLQFMEADREGKRTFALEEDLERTVRDIANAKLTAEHVVVMIHSHEMKDENMESIDDFIMESAHAFIDAGASMILGGGTHQLKGIELYRGRPIFYSLGNFIYQNEAVAILPPDFMDKYHLPYDTDPAQALAVRRSHAKNGGQQSAENFLSVVPYVEMEGETCVGIELLPISLGASKEKAFRGIPYPADQQETEEIYGALTRLSREFGTELELREGIIHLKLREG